MRPVSVGVGSLIFALVGCGTAESVQPGSQTDATESVDEVTVAEPVAAPEFVGIEEHELVKAISVALESRDIRALVAFPSQARPFVRVVVDEESLQSYTRSDVRSITSKEAIGRVTLAAQKVRDWEGFVHISFGELGP